MGYKSTSPAVSRPQSGVATNGTSSLPYWVTRHDATRMSHTHSCGRPQNRTSVPNVNVRPKPGYKCGEAGE